MQMCFSRIAITLCLLLRNFDRLKKTLSHRNTTRTGGFQGVLISDISLVKLKAQIRFLTNNKLHCALDFLRAFDNLLKTL